MIDWLVYSFVKTIGWLLCRLPPDAAVWLGDRLGILAYWLTPKRRQIGVRNLRAAFDGQFTPAQAHRIIRANFQGLGAGICELLRLPVIDRAYMDRYITVENYERLRQLAKGKRPVILLTGHIGNWELASIVAALRGHPIVAVARVQNNLPRLYTLLVSYRESKGCRIVHKGFAMRELMRALAQGRPVGIVGDQASSQGIFVDFFGRPALFATGPLELALKMDAVILPVFIRRVRGPHHRIAIEPPIELSKRLEKSEAVREGLERFAAILGRHIKEDPGQWLWMHKRWKRTPARRVLVLSDGKLGHLKQSLAVVDALWERRPGISHQVVEIRYRSRLARWWCLLWSWWRPARWGGTRCLQAALTAESSGALLGRYADLIISCGASTTPVNALWSAENGARSLVIMNPAPLPVSRFDLVIAPRHDGLRPRNNVFETVGAISRFRDDEMLEAGIRLQAHPKFRAGCTECEQATGTGNGSAPHRHPVVAVFLGGDTAQYELTSPFTAALVEQVLSACEAVDGWCLVTTSRRTAPAVERMLTERLAGHARCRFLLIASREATGGTMEGMLGSADVTVVTGESISMVSEACASGRHVVVVELPARPSARSTRTRHRRFLDELEHGGYIRTTPVPELGRAITSAVTEPRPSKRLEQIDRITEVVSNLL